MRFNEGLENSHILIQKWVRISRSTKPFCAICAHPFYSKQEIRKESVMYASLAHFHPFLGSKGGRSRREMEDSRLFTTLALCAIF